MDPATSSTLLTTAKVGIPIIKGVHDLLEKKGVYQAVIDWLLRKKPQDVVVLGATGAGKSALLRALQGLDASIPRDQRTDSKISTSGRFKTSGARFNFIDTPGQELSKDVRTGAILDAVRMDPPIGVINVVAYGYHENTTGSAITLDKDQPSASYLQKARDVELELLDEWTELLCGRSGTAAWVITLASKADLWWERGPDQSVLNYYRTGEYHQRLGSAQEIPNATLPYSSTNQLFYSISPMSGYYSDTLRTQHQNHFLAKLLEFTVLGNNK